MLELKTTGRCRHICREEVVKEVEMDNNEDIIDMGPLLTVNASLAGDEASEKVSLYVLCTGEYWVC